VQKDEFNIFISHGEELKKGVKHRTLLSPSQRRPGLLLLLDDAKGRFLL
jgi:hypothetical protein